MMNSKSVRALSLITAATAAVAMILPLSACGSAGGDAGKTTISLLSWSNEQMTWPYIDKFEQENPDIKIDFSYSPPTTEYISTLQTRLVGNQAPDVFYITSENKDDLIDNGYAMDLTNEDFMSNISQANKDFLSRDGKVYGMSTTSWAAGIVYNKDLLKQVGADEPPATWDEFLDLCQKLKNKGITSFIEPLADEPSRLVDGFQGSIQAEKGTDLTSLATEATQTPGSDEKEAVAAWQKLYTTGAADTQNIGVSGDDMKTQFVNGQVAMIIDGAWDFGTFEQSGIDWGFAELPVLEKGMEAWTQGSPSPGVTIYAKLEGKKLEAAKRWMKFLVSNWGLKKQNENGDAISVEGFDTKVIDQYKDVYRNQIMTGHYYLHTNYYSKPDVLKSELKAQGQELIAGNVTVNEYAKNIDEKLANAQ